MKKMVSIFFLFLALIVGSSMSFLTNDVKYHHNHHLNRLSRNNEQQQQQRLIRNIMGKLIDTETNTIYSIDGQKQQGLSSNTGIMAASMPLDLSTRFIEDLACLEACYKCVEDYPLTTRKKKAADNCGPMCDCADSCSRMSIDEINKIYGQGASTRGDKTCFWKTYIQSLNNELPSSSSSQ